MKYKLLKGGASDGFLRVGTVCKFNTERSGSYGYEILSIDSSSYCTIKRVRNGSGRVVKEKEKYSNQSMRALVPYDNEERARFIRSRTRIMTANNTSSLPYAKE